MSDGRRDLGFEAADHLCSPIQAKNGGRIAGRKNYFLIGGCAESGSHHSLTALPQ